MDAGESSSRNEQLRGIVAQCLTEALHQVAGGSVSSHISDNTTKEIVSSSISFPNKKDGIDGKPHDVEIRLALSLFHRWKRKRKCDREEYSVEIISEMGLTRRVNSPRELADLLLVPLEAACHREGIADYVRSQPSGMICIVTTQRSQLLRSVGNKLPCPHCTKWCHGEKGLWWHQQLHHKIEHSEAAEVAASSVETLALIPYVPLADIVQNSQGLNDSEPPKTNVVSEPLDFVKEGQLEDLKRAVEVGDVDGCCISSSFYAFSLVSHSCRMDSLHPRRWIGKVHLL